MYDRQKCTTSSSNSKSDVLVIVSASNPFYIILTRRQWYIRQQNDHFVKESRDKNYVSRAAFKLLQINEKFQIVKPNSVVIDLGASPGGWSQVVASLVKKTAGVQNGIISVDLVPLSPILDKKVTFIQGDFTTKDTQMLVKNSLQNIAKKANVILSYSQSFSNMSHYI